MTHIAMAIPSLTGAGAERTTLRIAGGLIERGHQVDIVMFEPTVAFKSDVPSSVRIFALCNRARWEQQARSDTHPNVRWEPNTVSRFSCLRSAILLLRENGTKVRLLMRRFKLENVLRLAYYIERECPNLVFANTLTAEIAVFVARCMIVRRPFPPIVPIVHIAIRQGSRQAERRKLMYGEFSHVVAVSNGVKESVVAATSLIDERITSIYNPIFTSDILISAKSKPNHHWFYDDGPPIVLGVGRLVDQKDFPTLIDAFRISLNTRLLRLIILGEGPNRHQLESLVHLHNLDSYVSLPGWNGNPYAFMSRASLFVLSSRREGFGNVIVEALACGCPVVSTDCPAGPSEILKDSGSLVPVGNAEALSKAMLCALNQSVDKSSLRRLAEQFNMEKSMQKYEKVICDQLQCCPQ